MNADIEKVNSIMYSVAVKREFIASHFHPQADEKKERELHSHHYVVEVELKGTHLDKQGYLIDICEIEPELDALVAHFKGKPLNNLSEFKGLNSSLEHFARIFHNALASRIRVEGLTTVSLQIWEDGSIRAGYREKY